MHTFPFHEKMVKIWKASGFLEYIFELFAIFDIQKYLKFSISYEGYMIGVYLLNLLILLIIIDVIYVSYSFSRKKFSMMWPLTILRSVTSLLVTVMFLPITETLISIVECSDKDGKLILDMFADEYDIECYKGWHLVHTVITCFFNLIFVLFSSVVALTYFEPKMTSENRVARQDSKGEVVFIVNKVIC